MGVKNIVYQKCTGIRLRRPYILASGSVRTYKIKNKYKVGSIVACNIKQWKGHGWLGFEPLLRFVQNQ